MSPSGYYSYYPYIWNIVVDGRVSDSKVNSGLAFRPVINLKSDVTVTGTGTSTDPYVVE